MKQQQQAPTGRRLILHFDINKTIVMKDAAKGEVSVTMTICKVLA